MPLYYGSIDGRENRELFQSQTNAIYGSGYLLFARGDQLLAQSFDPGTGKLNDEPQSVTNGVANDISTWHMDASASARGLLVFTSGVSGDFQLVFMDCSSRQISAAAPASPPACSHRSRPP